MQTLNCLYFPETVLPRHLRNCLLLLPDTLHFLQPVETAEPATDDLFMEQGICQAHTPSPLGKDRERFQRLIEEIRQQKDSIAEQLGSLTLAHLSGEQNSGDHSHRAIMGSLLNDQLSGSATEEEAEQSALWQARLVLSLAEILDHEEAELAMELSDIDNDELTLFQALKGEEETDAEEDAENPLAELIRIKEKISQPRPGTVKRRLQAWKRFYASGPLPETYWFWMTALEEAADLLISEYEAKSGRVSVPLLLLNIPEQMYMREEDALQGIRDFQKKAVAIRRDIATKLASIVNQDHLDLVDPVALLPEAGVLARDWNELIEYCFPEEKFGQRKLDLQFLANLSPDMIVRSRSPEKMEDVPRHTIVAFCRE